MFRAAMMLAALVASVSALTGTYRLSEVADEWSMTNASPARDIAIPLQFAVKNKNVKELMELVDRVSDPKSPFYGKHLSLQEVGDLTRNDEGAAIVQSFVQKFPVLDMHTSSPNAEFVSVMVTLDTAETMLQTSFSEYTNKVHNVTVHRCDHFFLPEEVHSVIDFIGHTTQLAPMGTPAMFQALSPADTSDASGQATPAVISQYYGITQNKIQNDKATDCVFETIGQSYAPADLETFDKDYGVQNPGTVTVKGPNDPSSCSANPNNCVEAELDVQVITAIAQEGETTFWSIPGSESFLQWIDAVAQDPTPPFVHSISYGAPEAEMDKSQAQRFDEEVAKMGARGLTVLVASGDDGVAGAAARSSKANCGFNPSYPATAPHVLAVGATMGPESSDPEITCQSDKGGVITSGGGFSTIFSASDASYQSAAVAEYLSSGPDLPPSSMFNKNGRGYPDVSAMGNAYPIVVAGSTYVGSGTSASTPVTAGMITLINSARLTAGKSTMGFINPFIYQNMDVFRPITVGKNNCAAGHSPNYICCPYGFTNAASGWSPSTGVGSPYFQKLLAAATAN